MAPAASTNKILTVKSNRSSRLAGAPTKQKDVIIRRNPGKSMMPIS